MKSSSLSLVKYAMAAVLTLLFGTAYSQYPATGNKQRLGWQTTGDGLVYRGAIADTSTLDPSGLNNAWMLLDTVSGNLYAYRIKAWRLVSGGGGGGGASMPFDSVTFNINEGDASEQELKYSAEKGYLQYGGLDSVQIPLLPGIWYVRNDTSVTIPKGTVVRASGTLGASGRIKVKHMIANGSIPAMYVLGIAMQDIATGADGYVMTQGKIRQVNTQAYSEGAVLYADVDTLGGLTQTKPGNGYLKLPIAFVVHSASNGTLAVRIDPGSSLHDLHDVDTTGRVNGSVLRYDSALKYWKASTTAGILASDTSTFVRQYQLSGTSGYLPKYTTDTTLGNSPLYNPSGNKIMLGHTSGNVLTTNIEVHSATSASPTLQSSIDVYMGNNTFADYTPYLQLYRNKGTTVGSVAKVNQGDWLGRLTFQGADGAKYIRAAQIYAITDAATALDSVAASLRFATTANGSTVPTDRMSITSAGRVGIGTTSPSCSLHVEGEARISDLTTDTPTRIVGADADGDLGAVTLGTGLSISSGTLNTSAILPADTSVFARDFQIGGNTNYLLKQIGNNATGNSPLYNEYNNRVSHSYAGFSGFLSIKNAYHLYGNGSTSDDQPMHFIEGNLGTTAVLAPQIRLLRSRATTPGASGGRVQFGDYLGYLSFWPNENIQFNQPSAYIAAVIDSITGNADFPTSIRFAVAPNGSEGAVERVTINNAGRVGIGTTSPARSLHVSATDAVRIPAGSNTQRTPSGVTNAVGDLRYNTEDSVENIEWYDVTGTYRRPVISALPTGFGTAGRFAQFKAGGLDTSDVIRQVVNKIAIDTSTADSTLTVGGSAKIAEGIAAKHFRPLVSGPGARPNIGMWSNATNTLNFSTNDTSRVQISSTGAMTITTAVTGPTTPVNSLTLNRGITAQNAFVLTGDSLANSAPQITVLNQDVGQSGGYVVFQKRRGASGAVQDGDELGTFSWGARRSVNAAIYASAGFRAAVNGTVTSDFVPVDFTIFTSPNTDGAPNYVPVKTDRLTVKPGGNVGIGTASPTAKLHINGSLSRNAPVTVTDATHTVAETTSWLICNRAGTVTLTLPTASSWTGREIMVKTIQAQTVISAATNISPLDGGALTTAILPATDGAWATLVSDGTNWIIMQRGS